MRLNVTVRLGGGGIHRRPERKRYLRGSNRGRNSPLPLSGDMTPQRHPVRPIKGYTYRHQPASLAGHVCSERAFSYASFRFHFFKHLINPPFIFISVAGPPIPQVWIQASFPHFIPLHIHIILSLCSQPRSFPPTPPAFVLQLLTSIFPTVPATSVLLLPARTPHPPGNSPVLPGNLGPFPPEPKSLVPRLSLSQFSCCSIAVVKHWFHLSYICFYISHTKNIIHTIYVHSDSTASICKTRTLLNQHLKRKTLTCQYSDDDIWPLCCHQTPIRIQPGAIFWLTLLLLRPDQQYRALDRHFVCCSALSSAINQGRSPTTNYSTWLEPPCELEGFPGQRFTWTPASSLWRSARGGFSSRKFTVTPGVQEVHRRGTANWHMEVVPVGN